MKLNSLLAEVGIPPEKNDTEIVNITDNLQKVREGTLFVCIRGEKTDGNSLIGAAKEKGAVFFVSAEALPMENSVQVENERLVYSLLCAAFYGHPDRKLKLIGITGTNGKTTTAQYIKYLLESTGSRCAVIGTLGVDTGEEREDTGYTTPSADTFFAALKKAVDAGNEYCVAEISSQALAQHRVDGAHFRLGIFTNIGRDHLDFHKTIDRLVEAKTRLCDLSSAVLINADDAYADRFFERAAGKKVFGYTCRARLSDFSAKNIKFQDFRSSYIFFDGKGVYPVALSSPGIISVYNSLTAISACVILGAHTSDLIKSAAALPEVEGRTQRINKNGVNVFIDFAHTPDALFLVLDALKKGTKGKLITVFGAGGDRDKTKRPIMGQVAAGLSDAVIVTSDNPRSEEPELIMKDILKGIKNKACVFTEPDREKAIRLALKKAIPGDTVVIAGKGHEKVQIVGDMAIPFSDQECVISF